MDYFSVFIQMLQTKGLTDNTIRSYKTYIKPYLNYLSSASVLPGDASWQIMRDYLSWIKSDRNLSDRTILYATSLRLDELCHLKCKDIISSTPQIHAADSKNHQDRFVPMPDMIWLMILSYYRNLPVHMKPNTWLFTQQRSTCNPMDKQWFQK
ncbi:MAG: phage integrase N-terminal SAM-like domain-containing protein, partial [Lachnospiraceae bacterium]